MVVETMREWATRHIISQGNHNPTEESVNKYMDMLENDSDDPTDQDIRLWIRQMYKRQVRGIYRPVPEKKIEEPSE